MAHLDHKGSETGRKLGKCNKVEKSEFEIGVGMGARRNSSDNCEGKGKRIKSGKMFNQ